MSPQQLCLRRTQTKSGKMGSSPQKTDEVTLSVCASSNALLGRNKMLKPGVRNNFRVISYVLKMASGGRSLEEKHAREPQSQIAGRQPGCTLLSLQWRGLVTLPISMQRCEGWPGLCQGPSTLPTYTKIIFGNRRKGAIVKSGSK